MAEQWELLLHHAYNGTPGVIFDQSPRRSSPGKAVNLTDDRFLRDGREFGAGAVDLSGGGFIAVEPGPDWFPFLGFKIEFQFARNQVAGSFDHLFNGGNAFSAEIRGDILNVFIPHEGGAAILRGFNIPAAVWQTITVTFDGVSTATLHVDDDEVSRVDRVFGKLVAPTSFVIGQMNGQVDDIKLWRLNPHRIGTEFNGRPMDPTVIDCWKQFIRRLVDALKILGEENSECQEFLQRTAERILYGGLGRVLTHSDVTRSLVLESSAEYKQLWAEGNLSAISDTLRRLIDGLQSEGIDLGQDPDLVALLQSSCWQRLLELLGSFECDEQFTDMFAGVVR
jgi:hypothetical protein